MTTPESLSIVMSTTYYSPHISGLTLYFQQLAEEYVKLGHRVTVLAAQHDKSLPLVETINGVSVVRTPYLFKANKGLFLHRSLIDFRTHLKSADVVHFNLPSTEGLPLAALAKAMRKPILSTYVCDITLPEFTGSKVLDAVVQWINVSTLKLSTKLSSLTKDFAQESPVLGRFDIDDIAEIYPPLTYDQDAAPDAELTERMSSGTTKIGMATRFAADKGIHLVLESIPELVAQCDDPHLYLAGDPTPVGEERYRKSLESMLAKHSDRITVLGTITTPQMATFYRELDVLVIASTNSTEAFGIVQIEAMAEGTPVVATNLPGVRVPVQVSGMGEIAAVGDRADLSSKIAKVLNNRSDYLAGHGVGQTSPAGDSPLFSVEASVTDYLSLYAETIAAN